MLLHHSSQRQLRYNENLPKRLILDDELLCRERSPMRDADERIRSLFEMFPENVQIKE